MRPLLYRMDISFSLRLIHFTFGVNKLLFGNKITYKKQASLAQKTKSNAKVTQHITNVISYFF